ADPTKGFTATYDAWNRLLKIVDVPTSQTVQENAYDGRTFRVVRKTYTAGVLSETRRMLYSTGWQVVEERTGATAERQFVWGRRYIDDLVVRDRDTTGGGTLNERLYVSQDPNWNTVAISTSVGAGQERYAYSAYGAVSFLTGAFAVRVSSLFDWEILYASYRWELFPRLYVVRYRVLHPRLGGWIQRDPVGYSDGLSLYEYITSRCTTSTDPFGLRMDDQSDQRRLDYLRCIMKELVEVASDYSRRPEPGGWDWRRVHERHQCTAYPPSFKSGSAPFPKHTFPETRELMLAFCRQYPTVGYFGVNVCDDDAASNWPVIPGLSIPRPIFEGREVDAMCSLTHEPLHNWGANKQSWTLLWIFPTGFDGHSKTTKEMIPPSGCRTVEDNVSDLVAWAGAQRWDPPGVSDKSYSKSLWDFIQAHCKRKVYDKYLNKKAKR
ncbi:MAG: hypothetical protein NT069_03925, partial [Planctomycetota bacterium]|nr:hypothetical protein [Planctomycetota bacterium]